MDSELFKPVLAGFLRHVLTSAGGALVTAGYIQSSDVAGLVGAGMVLGGAMWSWWQKEGQMKATAILAKMKPVASPGATTADAVKAANVAVKEAQKA